MRTIPAAAQAMFQSGIYSTHLRVTIDGTDMTALEGLDWVDSAQVSTTADRAISTAQVSLRLRFAGLSLATLMDGSKLNAGGTLVDVSKAIEIFVALAPTGALPQSADWVSIFKGSVDSVAWSRDPVALSCRDLAGVLEDTFIEIQRVYGTALGVDVEDVMQDILDDNMGVGVVTLYSITGTAGTPFQAADSPGWLLRPYKQSKESVLSALRRLAQQIGWELRYLFNDSVGDWCLTFYDPMRERRARGTLALTGLPVAAQTFTVNATVCTAVAIAPGANQFRIGSTAAATCDNIVAMLLAGAEAANLTAWRLDDSVVIEWGTVGVAGNAIVFTEALTNATVDGAGFLGGTQLGRGTPAAAFTFRPQDYSSLSRVEIANRTVRNAVKVVFSNVEDGLRTSVLRTDAASIARYGRRYMELALGSADQIDTFSEASTLANAVLEDLKEPDVAIGAEILGCFPWGELGDMITFNPNGEHFDTAQSLAVEGMTMKIQSAAVMLSLACCGRPGGGDQRWAQMEGGRGAGPAVDEYDDAAATGATATAALGMIIVEYDDPRTMDPPVPDWAVTECHISATSGFTPDATTLAAVGRQTRFEIGGLAPGVTYYAKLVIIDEQGNRATTTAQVSIATQLVGAYHENTDTVGVCLVPNGTFGQRTLGTSYPPDRWDVTVGAWGTEVVLNTTDTNKGGVSVELTDDGGGDGEITSDFIPVDVMGMYQFRCVLKASIAGGDHDVRLGYRTYDKSKAYLGENYTTTTLVTSWWSGGFGAGIGFASGNGIVPAGTLTSTVRYIKLFVRRDDTAAGDGYHVVIDRITGVRALHRFSGYKWADQAVTTGTPTVLAVGDVDIENGFLDTGTVWYGLDWTGVYNQGRFTANQEGAYYFSAGVTLNALGAGKYVKLDFYVNGALEEEGMKVYAAAAGDTRAIGGCMIDLARGDYVEVVVTHDHGSDRNIDGSTNYFNGFFTSADE